MIFLTFLTRFLPPLIFLVSYIGCAEKDLDPDSPADAFSVAREYYDDENYDIAVQKLGEFKSRFPYSKFAVMAEIFIANCHFELGNYEEAALEYKQFSKLHPKHEKAPFAMFRVGESYWIDAPEEIDRDQELTERAIEEWRNLVAAFPQSKYTERAQSKIDLGLRRIAESHKFVADFYCKMEKFHACAYRFIQLLEKYPKYLDIRKHALETASSALLEISMTKREDPKSDKNVFFKTMTWQEIETKSKELENLAKKVQLPKESH